MNKRMYRLLMGVLTALLCLTLLSGTALGADTQTIQVPVQIRQTGQLIEAEEVYTVVLAADETGFPMPDGSTGGKYSTEITGAGRTVMEMRYDRVGVYTYTLYQTPGTTKHCAYDDTVYHMTVYVTATEDGGLETTTVLYGDDGGTKLVQADFVNTYRAGAPAKVTPTVEKIVKAVSGTAPQDTEFTFLLTPVEADMPMPQAETVDPATGAVTMKRTGAGTVSFGEITFDAACVGKTYVYTISEVQGSAQGYTYDTQTYQMMVTVSARDGEIQAEVSYCDTAGNAVEAMTFTNTYEAPAAPSPSPSVSPKPTEMPQTGQLWWPVLALAGIGVLLVLGGVLLKRKKA